MEQKNWTGKIGKVLFRAFCWFYAGISLYPVIWLIFYSFKNNSEIFVTNPFGVPTILHWENYQKAWSQYNVPMYFTNSLIVSIITVILTIILALLFSYATARMQWKGRNTAKIYMSLGMFIPIQAILIPVAKLVNGLGLDSTRTGLILVYTAINLSFATLVYYGSLKALPVELEEAACMDGANIFVCFFRIIVPLVKPATATLVIYIFLNAWNEFNLANVLVVQERLKTLPLGLLFLQGAFTTDWGAMGATMVIASLPTIILYCIFSKKVEGAMTIGGAVKG
ncbi:carbohydrate ABC transporter permease [Anaeromicropila populeti]|uniref:Raffinose/stachyose/melibiose transport system permease protein n=1 Tax=Anaeromicropila populeti TaxID=37658 RepID=A0A1I6IPX9_9FIRM|nr:carbohydrate ABC transporter permease [Anaeromicropila populeti]SFR68793.1 raffinose/stachyose/melibiose transport system permease protein [Anaeromicropila populeti]